MAIDPFVPESTQPGDRYTDFCLWDYPPAAPTEGKLRSVNLLYHSFAVAGVEGQLRPLCDAVRRAVGPFKTVWGVKLQDGKLSWELYFYDYRRQAREVSIPLVLAALAPFAPCDLSYAESHSYFMFSIDIDTDLAQGRRAIDKIDVYLGNPGSSVSSGICYALTAEGLSLSNFYFFFDAQREREDILGKVTQSAYIDPQGFDPGQVLWPELLDCTTLVVANKRRNDGVYFTRIGVEALLGFLHRFGFPAPLGAFVAAERGRLDHLRFDVAFDYRTSNGRLELLKGSYYGYF